MTLWQIALIAVGAGIVLAILAAAVKRDWIALPIVAVLALVLALRVIGLPLPEEPWFSPALGAALVALATVGGGPLVAFVLRVLVKTPQRPGRHGGIVTENRKRNKIGKGESEVLRGGTTIGYLERFALAGAVLVGQPAAVAVIVAIKGLGRFTELDSAAARERFIIGTLLSFTWAAACTAGVVSTWA
jgi:hypothetical protein